MAASKPRQLARYRQVYPAFWRDEKVVALSLEEKAVALYCMTGPQSNRIGLFTFSPGAGAEDCGTLPQTFALRFAKVVKTLRWGWDERLRVLYIPTWWKWNQPANPNVLKSTLDDLTELPQTPLLQEFASNTEYLRGTLPQTFTQTLGRRLRKVSPHQEQEQEQEQEQKRAATPPVFSDGSDNGNPKRKPKPTIPVPATLDTPQFHAAWTEWLAYRRERKLTLTHRTIAKQLAALEAWGEPAAIQAIGDAIRGGWQGLFEPKPDGRKPAGPHVTHLAPGPGEEIAYNPESGEDFIRKIDPRN